MKVIRKRFQEESKRFTSFVNVACEVARVINPALEQQPLPVFGNRHYTTHIALFRRMTLSASVAKVSRGCSRKPVRDGFKVTVERKRNVFPTPLHPAFLCHRCFHCLTPSPSPCFFLARICFHRRAEIKWISPHARSFTRSDIHACSYASFGLIGVARIAVT